jgi:hypothetical protein
MSLAFWIVTLAVAMGASLAVLFLRPVWPRSAWLAAIHGLVGTGGLALLVLALNTPDARADALGVGAFAKFAAVAIGGAWMLGLGLAFWRFRAPRGRGLLIAVHASLAVFGYVLFMAYRSLG